MSDIIHSPSTYNTNDYSQQEDAALKTAMQFFATDLLPFFQISGSVKGITLTELSHMESVLYLMADKLLELSALNKLKEDLHMAQLGQILVDWGIEQGIEQGIQKGAEQKTQEFIINALKLGLSDADILRLTE